MSADASATWQIQSAESWKVSLPCSRAEGEAVAALGELPGVDPAPVVMASEPDPARPDAVTIDAVRRLAPSAAHVEPTVERIEDADWVTISQRWLEPIRAGRFFVHTAAHAADIPDDVIPFTIEAGRAFGTGHHETTAGCLAMLDGLEQAGARFARIADVGTGTGLLAFAARALWPEAMVIASDIDPVSIEVVVTNMAANGIPPHAIALAVADGMGGAALEVAKPFDLVIANILAGPLIAMAPDIVNAIVPGGTIVLAGLLASQAQDVLQAYAMLGATPAYRMERGDWSILALVHGV